MAKKSPSSSKFVYIITLLKFNNRTHITRKQSLCIYL